MMQSSNTDLLMFPVAESLVYLTEGITLEPGDILFTGTPSGVGHARKPEPVWMKAGDTVEVEVQGIGASSRTASRTRSNPETLTRWTTCAAPARLLRSKRAAALPWGGALAKAQ